MVAVAFVLFRLIADNESGKADARLAATKGSAINLYREDYNRANRAAEKIGGDVALAQALRTNDTPGAPGAPGRPAQAGERAPDRRSRAATGRSPSRAARPRSSRRRATSSAGATGRSARCRCRCRSRRPTRACSRAVTDSGAVVQRVGGPVLASSLKGVDPGSIPSDHGELSRSATSASTRPRSPRPASSARPIGSPCSRPRRRSPPPCARAACWRPASWPASSSSPSPSRCWSRARCSARSTPSCRPPGAWARATSPSRSRPRATTSSRRWARSSTRCRASSRSAWRSSTRSARACRTRCAASARPSPPTSIARACWRSSSGPRSTASGPTPAAPRCGRTPARRSSRWR